ncbi:hypothetical protein ACUODF_37830, partial [Escherichia coli]
MKKAKILSGVLLLCFSSPLISQAATLDVRGGYRSGSHAYETRLKVSEGWQNGWWASMESNTWNTIHDNKKENAALNDVQVEVNYAIKIKIFCRVPGQFYVGSVACAIAAKMR